MNNILQLNELSISAIDSKSVLVTGATGTFGVVFTQTILRLKPYRVIALSRDESKQQLFLSKLKKTHPHECSKIRFVIGDIRDYNRLVDLFANIDIVVHAAALKQVPTLEYNPGEAIKTNIIGTENVIRAAVACNVGHVIGVSSDKAVAPANLYGSTKLCMEKLFMAAKFSHSMATTKFTIVRYGNVFASRDSVVPLFHQMKDSGILTLTDLGMTRFSITIHQAVNMILNILSFSLGGEIFIPKLPSYKILTLAEAIAPDCPHMVIGVRAGEKLDEAMFTKEDARDIYETRSCFIKIPDWECNKDSIESIKALGGELLNKLKSYCSGSNGLWLSTEELSQLYHSWLKGEYERENWQEISSVQSKLKE